MDMKLEVLVVPVSDVDRAKAFYEKLGFRLDVDYAAPNGDYRIIQFTPPGSEASIIFGKGITSAQPGSIDRLVLAVYDIGAARRELLSHGVEVSEVFHDAGRWPRRRVLRRYRGARRGSGSPAPFLRLVCLVQGSRRQRLAAAGNQGAAAWKDDPRIAQRKYDRHPARGA